MLIVFALLYALSPAPLFAARVSKKSHTPYAMSEEHELPAEITPLKDLFVEPLNDPLLLIKGHAPEPRTRSFWLFIGNKLYSPSLTIWNDTQKKMITHIPAAITHCINQSATLLGVFQRDSSPEHTKHNLMIVQVNTGKQQSIGKLKDSLYKSYKPITLNFNHASSHLCAASEAALTVFDIQRSKPIGSFIPKYTRAAAAAYLIDSSILVDFDVQGMLHYWDYRQPLDTKLASTSDAYPVFSGFCSTQGSIALSNYCYATRMRTAEIPHHCDDEPPILHIVEPEKVTRLPKHPAFNHPFLLNTARTMIASFCRRDPWQCAYYTSPITLFGASHGGSERPLLLNDSDTEGLYNRAHYSAPILLFNPSGSRLLTMSPSKGHKSSQIALWNVYTGTKAQTLSVPKTLKPHDACFNTTGSKLHIVGSSRSSGARKRAVLTTYA